MRTHSASYGFKKIETFDIFFASPLKGNQILHQMKDQKSMKFNTSQEMHTWVKLFLPTNFFFSNAGAPEFIPYQSKGYHPDQ